MPEALVFSNFPIVARVLQGILQNNYRVSCRSWPQAGEPCSVGAELVIGDTTEIEWPRISVLFQCVTTSGLVVLCSLHQNSVDVYRLGPSGPQLDHQLASLLALAP